MAHLVDERHDCYSGRNAREGEGAFFGRPRNDRRPAIVLTERRCYLDLVTILATAYTPYTLVAKTSSSPRARGCAIVCLTTRRRVVFLGDPGDPGFTLQRTLELRSSMFEIFVRYV